MDTQFQWNYLDRHGIPEHVCWLCRMYQTSWSSSDQLHRDTESYFRLLITCASRVGEYSTLLVIEILSHTPFD
jgi:hypothetical protein